MGNNLNLNYCGEVVGMRQGTCQTHDFFNILRRIIDYRNPCDFGDSDLPFQPSALSFSPTLSDRQKPEFHETVSGVSWIDHDASAAGLAV